LCGWKCSVTKIADAALPAEPSCISVLFYSGLNPLPSSVNVEKCQTYTLLLLYSLSHDNSPKFKYPVRSAVSVAPSCKTRRLGDMSCTRFSGPVKQCLKKVFSPGLCEIRLVKNNYLFDKKKGNKFFLFIEHEVLFYETPFLHRTRRNFVCAVIGKQ
jgi:hypothetical protein